MNDDLQGQMSLFDYSTKTTTAKHKNSHSKPKRLYKRLVYYVHESNIYECRLLENCDKFFILCSPWIGEFKTKKIFNTYDEAVEQVAKFFHDKHNSTK